MNRQCRACLLAVVTPLLLVGIERSPGSPLGLTIVQDAAAIVGAPLTPVSVAGVARRTTRRVVAAEAGAAAATQQATAQQQQATAQQQSATAQQQAATAQQQAAAAKPQAAAATAAPAMPPTPGTGATPAAQGRPALGSIVPALPGGCASSPKGGVEYYRCGDIYYRAAFQGNNLVYVVVQP